LRSTQRRRARRAARHKKVEEALRESEEKFRNFVEKSSDGIVLIDERGYIVEWSEGQEKLTGLSRVEALARAIWNIQFLLLPDERKTSRVRTKMKSETLSVLRTGRSSMHGRESEVEIQKVDGTRRLIQTAVFPIKTPSGWMVGSISRDITERKRAEEALNQSEVKYRGLVEQSLVGIGISQGNRVIFANPALLNMFGYDSLEEFVKIPLIDHVAPKSREYIEARMKKLARGEQMSQKFEYDIIRRDGKTRILQASLRHVTLGNETYTESVFQDITERKRAEEALANERNVLRTLIDNLPDNIFVKDTESRFVLSNLAHAHLLRAKTPDEIVGKTDYDIFPHELAASYHADEQAVIRSGQRLLNREERTIDSEGKTRWLLTTKVPLRNDQGKVIGIAGINRDITERKRMQDDIKRYSEHLEELVKERTENLAESETRYRRLFESSPISLWEEDFSEVKKYFDDLRSRGIKNLRRYFIEHPEELVRCAGMAKILDVNQATLGLYGAKTVEELRGELSRIFTRDFQDKFTEELVALSEGRTLFASEFDNQALTGDVKHVNLILSVVPGYEDTLEKVLVSIIDLTERKRMEEELRSTKERLEYVVTSNPAIIYSGKPLADLSDWELTYISENVTNLLGYETREFVGHPEFWTHVVHPVDRPSVLAQMPRLWEKGRFMFEYRMRHKDGDYKWVREEANVIRDLEGKPVDVTGYWIDITELKRLEAQLAESQRLAAIGETATMVGHDLRNPLQAITSTLFVAKRLVRSEKIEDRKEAAGLLGTLDDAIEYMDKIVSDLQDYARPIGADLVKTSLPDLVRATVASMKIPGNVKVTVKIEAKLSNVRLDPLLFRRVLTNLILNAVQAMPKGGKLAITGSRKGATLTVAVQDTGVGIAPENLEKVFNPFFTTKAKGQGLGLAVCKRLTEAQGGTITVTSQVGEGSKFTLKIPTNRTLAAT